MKRRDLVLSSLAATVLGVAMAGCGGEASPAQPPAITVTVSPAVDTVQMGGTARFSASVMNDFGGKGVNWSITCAAAPCGTVSPTSSLSGAAVTYTVPNSPPASDLKVTLTATSVADPTKSSAAVITVPSVTISVTPSAATALANGTAEFIATVGNDTSNKGVAWTVSCAPTPCGSFSPATTASGAATTYTAPPPPANDLQVTITATSVADSPARGSASVTVPAIVVNTLPSSLTVPGNTTAQVTATVDNDLANRGVTWTVSCSPPPCGSISPASTASGVATAYTAPPQLPSDLTVTIQATSVADPTKYSSATATIPAIRVSAISPNSALLPENTTQDFAATVTYDASNQGVAWTLTQNATACSPACGTVSPATTASGAATTYTAPSALPANAAVTLNATSVADSTKAATASFTLTKGTVKLVPASLAFQCKLGKNCPPPSQSVALTNTGAAALAISSITVDLSTFGQTNDCPVSVNAAGSCSIMVKVQAAEFGSGNLVIKDSSVDSPQQVPLSFTTNPMGAANAVRVRSDLAATTYAEVPRPTGPNAVGTNVLYLTDAPREDPYLANGTTRELAVRLWHPASPNAAVDCRTAAYASPAVWRYFTELAGVEPFSVRTNSCWNAPIADGVHPVVVFSPGYTATATDYTFLLEDLASRGYFVAAINHTYEATAVELRDGHLARSMVGSHLGGPVLRASWPMSSAVSVRSKDLQFVLTGIESLNARRDSPFAGKLDMAKIVAAGHSLGGLTAYLGIVSDPRLKAAVMLDAAVPDAFGSAIRKPVLMITAGRQRWDASECRLWKNLQGPRLAVNLRGTEHVAFSDWIWLAGDAVQVGPMGPEKTMAAVRDYVAAFLDANLRDVPSASPPTTVYSDATATTQDQPLCRDQANR